MDLLMIDISDLHETPHDHETSLKFKSWASWTLEYGFAHFSGLGMGKGLGPGMLELWI